MCTKTLLILFSSLIISMNSFAGGSRKLINLCKDNKQNMAIKTTRSGIWDFFNTVPEKIEIFKIKKNGKLKKLKRERLFSKDGMATVKYFQEIEGKTYQMMYESDTYEYYVGLKDAPGSNIKQRALYNKVKNETQLYECDI